MIEVELPDGSIAEFPDGTSPDVIKGALQKRFAAPQQAAPTPQMQPQAQPEGQSPGMMESLGVARDAGLTLGFDDEIGAGMVAPFRAVTDMVQGKGFDLSRAYTGALERNRARKTEAQEANPGTYAVGEIGGSLLSLGKLQGLGATASRFLPAGLTGAKGLAATSAASGADALAINEVMNLGNSRDFGENAGLAAALGVAAPVAAAGASKLFDMGKAAIGVGNEQRAKKAIYEALQRSGKTQQEVADDLLLASQEGQGVYNLADSLGNSGQRMLSGVARSPGDMRQTIAETLQKRQGDQATRLSSALQDAAGTNLTAEQTKALLQSRRAADAAKNYGPVQSDITPIDVSAAVAEANKRISPAANMMATARGDLATDIVSRAPIETGERALRDPIREALREARSYLAADTLTASNVNKAFRAKTNIDQMIASATERGQGALVGELVAVRNALDDTLAKTSKTYAGARDVYSRQSGEIDAIDIGREAARGTRQAEDILNEFGTLPANQIEPYRAGFFDRLAQKVQGSSFGTDKSRPLITNANEQLFSAIPAPGKGEALLRKVGREQRMFETRNAALGGSRTADNLADMGEMGMIDPSMVGNLLMGNWKQAAISGVTKGANALQGRNSATRDLIAKALLSTGSQGAKETAAAIMAGQKLTANQDKLARMLLGAGLVSMPAN